MEENAGPSEEERYGGGFCGNLTVMSDTMEDGPLSVQDVVTYIV